MVCCHFQIHKSYYLYLLAIPPPISLSTNSTQISIGSLREFSLTCQSIGDFSGPVVWMKDGTIVPTIGLLKFCLSMAVHT